MKGPPSRDLVRAGHLFALDVGGRNDVRGIAAAAEEVMARLDEHLARWIGTDGARAVLTRALDQARLEHSTLANVRLGARGQPPLSGLAESVRSHHPGEVQAAILALIAAVTGLLARLIGEDIVTRLLEAVWPQASTDELRSEMRTPDTRTRTSG